MKSKFVLWIFLVFLGGFVLYSGESMLLQRSIAAKTIRLHVVANSDSQEDQAQKIRLRDHILQEIAAIASKCSSREEAHNAISSHLEALQVSAQRFLQQEGSHYRVQVSLCREKFTTRTYPSFSLPAGDYDSLRISIGDAKGKNWWCVVFPSLCSAATREDFVSCAELGGYTEDEISLISDTEPKYQLRFKLLDWVNSIFH